MSDDASTSSTTAGDLEEKPHWTDKIPMWGPAILLIVLAVVLKFGDDPSEAVAKSAPAAAAATAAPDTEALGEARMDAVLEDDEPAGASTAPGSEVAAVSAPPPPAHPAAPRLPAPAQPYESPWAAQGQQQAFQRYGVPPQGHHQPRSHHQLQPPAMPAQAAAPAGNNPYVPCAAPYYWCVPALPGQ